MVHFGSIMMRTQINLTMLQITWCMWCIAPHHSCQSMGMWVMMMHFLDHPWIETQWSWCLWYILRSHYHHGALIALFIGIHRWWDRSCDVWIPLSMTHWSSHGWIAVQRLHDPWTAFPSSCTDCTIHSKVTSYHDSSLIAHHQSWYASSLCCCHDWSYHNHGSVDWRQWRCACWSIMNTWYNGGNRLEHSRDGDEDI